MPASPEEVKVRLKIESNVGVLRRHVKRAIAELGQANRAAAELVALLDETHVQLAELGINLEVQE